MHDLAMHAEAEIEVEAAEEQHQASAVSFAIVRLSLQYSRQTWQHKNWNVITVARKRRRKWRPTWRHQQSLRRCTPFAQIVTNDTHDLQNRQRVLAELVLFAAEQKLLF